MSFELTENMKICQRCIYDDNTPAISFDEAGVCNYCHMTDNLIDQYGTGRPEGKKKLETIVEEIKRKGKKRKYDCVVGVSGGTDSTYLLDWAVKNGLRPLAVHYDNTWNSSIATENIRKTLACLKVDLFTYVVNNNEADDIFRSFFLSGVPELEASTDLALAEVLYRASAKYGVDYILEGHSFVTEGITPLAKNYFDGRYIHSIHKKFGRLPMKTYPLMTLYNFLKWVCFYRIKKIRPFWYIDYDKTEAQTYLQEKFDWQYYGGHHLENRMTSFLHKIYLPGKFGVDYSSNSIAAAVRKGAISREEGIEMYYGAQSNTDEQQELIEIFQKRLGFSEQEFQSIMNDVPRNWTEFPTYKRTFEVLRPLFFLLLKLEIIPETFFMKYCH